MGVFFWVKIQKHSRIDSEKFFVVRLAEMRDRVLIGGVMKQIILIVLLFSNNVFCMIQSYDKKQVALSIVTQSVRTKKMAVEIASKVKSVHDEALDKFQNTALVESALEVKTFVHKNSSGCVIYGHYKIIAPLIALFEVMPGIVLGDSHCEDNTQYLMFCDSAIAVSGGCVNPIMVAFDISGNVVEIEKEDDSEDVFLSPLSEHDFKHNSFDTPKEYANLNSRNGLRRSSPPENLVCDSTESSLSASKPRDAPTKEFRLPLPSYLNPELTTCQACSLRK
jgi:hypothetical protein